MLGEYNSKADTSLSQKQSDASSGLTLDVCIQREWTVHYEEFFFLIYVMLWNKKNRNTILILCANLTMDDQTMVYILKSNK